MFRFAFALDVTLKTTVRTGKSRRWRPPRAFPKGRGLLRSHPDGCTRLINHDFPLGCAFGEVGPEDFTEAGRIVFPIPWFVPVGIPAVFFTVQNQPFPSVFDLKSFRR